ncbi:MAG: DUF721 domain-containing protein [Candidatus Eremiobacteraeota bacterium]|nr:DUF721 domain-containing protein [Candidatus Eremiobacteraeota bacterium]
MSLRPLRAALEQWKPAPGAGAEPLQAITAAWPGIVGEQVAAHCAPVAITGDALAIATRSSAWSQQLQFLSTTILGRLRALAAGSPDGRQISRLSFRSGRFRPRHTAAVGRPLGRAVRSAPRRSEEPPEPAADLWDALERVRRRVNRLQHAARAHCVDCGLALAVGEAYGEASRRSGAELTLRCAPCANGVRGARFIAVARALYVTPWLGYEELREQIPALRRDDYEQARRDLLARWWGILERARRAGRLCASGFERDIAGSYVLLHSRLTPDRMTPAVARNLLGSELEGLLALPATAAPRSTKARS